jgi:transcriptional regulator with XRE-family HTH domain
VTAEEIKTLRKELRCTSRELAEALGLELSVVMAWEDEEMFPTKRHVTQMEKLRTQGPGAVPRKRRGRGATGSPLKLLAEPEIWGLIRKLLVHAELREQVQKLAEAYPEPEDG